ncbi:mitochondrial hydrolase YKR070W-like isoform X1 [Silene latifolia]|uniref:mitochondrial hydrolase YKR070W-like isoform X1 n=1 Tax=Silene latifolia TaxID=37657 RepID=UPI003D7726B9
MMLSSHTQMAPVAPTLKSHAHPFAIAFDIDGVILRGRQPIGGSPLAIRKLYHPQGSLKVPFLFLTNGGGVPESRRASVLSELLGVNILPSQVLQGHTLFKNLLGRYQNELIVVTGLGDPALVMREYGFKKVLSLEEYASFFKDIDPVGQYKNWTTTSTISGNSHLKMHTSGFDVYTERVKAAFVASDPVDWGRDIQVLCDILRSGGLPGHENGDQPALYFAADDLEYQAEYPVKRLGRGAFRIALESVFNRIHHTPLEYTIYGKPEPIVFKNADANLRELHSSCAIGHDLYTSENASPYFRAIYMIGDNPSVDVKGARQAGQPWISVLTRTGVFQGTGNDREHPADLVVDTVEDAVDYILMKEHVQ